MELDVSKARYNHTCLLALTGKTEQALQELGQVLAESPDERTQTARNEDFELLATHPEFRKLIGADEAVAVDKAKYE